MGYAGRYQGDAENKTGKKEYLESMVEYLPLEVYIHLTTFERESQLIGGIRPPPRPFDKLSATPPSL